MPAISRETDTLITGHDCSYTSTLESGSQTGNIKNVFANSLGISCVGDPVTSHTWDSANNCPSCPSPVTVTGSSTVFIGGKAVVRIGDEADQNGPGTMTQGSGSVFCK